MSKYMHYVRFREVIYYLLWWVHAALSSVIVVAFTYDFVPDGSTVLVSFMSLAGVILAILSRCLPQRWFLKKAVVLMHPDTAPSMIGNGDSGLVAYWYNQDEMVSGNPLKGGSEFFVKKLNNKEPVKMGAFMVITCVFMGIAVFALAGAVVFAILASKRTGDARELMLFFYTICFSSVFMLPVVVVMRYLYYKERVCEGCGVLGSKVFNSVIKNAEWDTTETSTHSYQEKVGTTTLKTSSGAHVADVDVYAKKTYESKKVYHHGEVICSCTCAYCGKKQQVGDYWVKRIK